MQRAQSNAHSLCPWQEQVSQSEYISGFYRKGVKQSKRVHLLHGTGFSALTLKEMAFLLPEDWNLWLTNVPGHGQSTQPKHIMPDWQDMAAKVAKAVYQNADIPNQGPVIGVGHSLGGVLTLLAASKHPEYFSRIILLDPPLFVRSLLFTQKLLRGSGFWKKVPWVKAVHNRTQHWPNKSLMRQELQTKKLYKNWQPQVLDDFVDSATEITNSGEIKLACNPQWEAEIFGSYPRKLWHSIAKTKVHVDVVIADNTYGFIKPAVKRASKLSRYIHCHYFGNNHCFPMEQPKDTAELIKHLLSS
ncbi:alpha/beta hydrolase [Thalassotalea sp. M1531]|uniref:Alpha/beta hydrolase n=1 Tax=Thalassotalea algicola TaxID=2716224 RepID=A0A7Y0Q7U0_9GAMM|nr:alpha/beta hydrolase [Thalassotalea algicola]NMP32267.1 alpha/beta hydrolase [Thalassotalea algicola]